MQRRLQSNPDNGYDVGHAEGRRRGQDDDPKGEVRQQNFIGPKFLSDPN